MTLPLVSCKMITYNHAPFIARAIEGVLQQKTKFPVELVIGEDCSTDGTREIVLAYHKKRPDIIRVIMSDKNVGMRRNSERTRLACRGKYLAFCEGDDYWHDPHKLQKQVDYMEDHPECGLVYSSYDVYNVESKRKRKDYLNDLIRRHNWQRPDNPTIADFLGGKPRIGYGILTCTVMVRRDLLEKTIESDPVLYQSDRFMRGDTQLWAEIANVSAIHYIPDSLATYNQVNESATRSKDITKLLRLHVADAELWLYLCNKYNLPSGVKNEMEARKDYALLRLAFYTRSAKLADEVRTNRGRFHLKEWCLYYGAKNAIAHYPFRLVVSLLNVVSKTRTQWQ